MIDPQTQVANFNSIIDYLKHLTTLSTGSIILIATFWEKFSKKPKGMSAVVTSVVGFMLSVLSSVIAHTLLIMFERPGSLDSPSWVATLGGLSIFMSWVGFLAGILGLATFAVKNLSQKDS